MRPVVTSLIVCKYGTPFKKASAWTDPRLGTEPRLAENDRVSCVRLSSSTLSLPPTGTGKCVGVVGLSGRKISLNPLPMKVPTKCASGPRAGVADGAAAATACTASNRKSLGSDSAAVSGAGSSLALASGTARGAAVASVPTPSPLTSCALSVATVSGIPSAIALGPFLVNCLDGLPPGCAYPSFHPNVARQCHRRAR